MKLKIMDRREEQVYRYYYFRSGRRPVKLTHASRNDYVIKKSTVPIGDSVERGDMNRQ